METLNSTVLVSNNTKNKKKRLVILPTIALIPTIVFARYLYKDNTEVGVILVLSILIEVALTGLLWMIAEMMLKEQKLLKGTLMQILTPEADDKGIWRTPVTVDTKDGEANIRLTNTEYLSLTYSGEKVGDDVALIKYTSVLGGSFHQFRKI
ncbi:MAG: hypothetical protein WCJ81_02460 [bacterium]